MSPPMKVLHIVKTAVGAGWAYEQVRVLCSLGVEVVVALPSDTEGFAPRYREAGARVVAAKLDLPARRPWEAPAVLGSCRRLVREVAPDLIQTHHVGTTLIVRAALGKNSPISRVFLVPGPLHLENNFFASLETRLAGPRDHWIATCEWTRRKYLELGIPPERVFLSYSGIDVTRFDDLPAGRLRRELGISRQVPLVGMVAYMYAPKWFLGEGRGLKGHEDFIAALRIAREVRPEIRGVIIGGPWSSAARYENRLRYLGSRDCDGSLKFLGIRRDVPALYPDLDLAVVPSLSENVGGAVEPLLCGVPVVATKVGGLPDLIHDGETGWLVPPRSPAALARAMLEALENRDEARRRALAGQNLARRLFDVERTGRETAAFYEKILVRKSARRTSLHSESSKKIRVLHALGTMDPGGVETWLMNVLRNIDRDRFEFHFCTFGDHPGLFASEVEKLGGKILPCPRDGSPASFPSRFRRILRDGRYDVVHSHVHLFSGAVLRWASADGVPIRIAHSHTSNDGKPDSLARRSYRKWMRAWISRYATHGLAASKLAAAKLFGDSWPSDPRIQVLHCGIDLSAFQSPLAKSEVRREFGIPDDAPVVGHVGRFVPPKNHQFFLDVANEMIKRRPETHFLLVGDGPLRPHVESRAATLGFNGRMHFAGIRTDVPRLMRGAMDAFVFPSIWEGLPVTLVEAQAAGLRCVLSDAVTEEAKILPQQITQLSLSKAPEEWAAGALDALAKPRISCGVALHGLAQTDFCAHRSVRRLFDLYLGWGE